MQSPRAIGGQLLWVFLFCMAAAGNAASISIWTEPKPALVFSGENRMIQLYVKNAGPAAVKIRIESRIYQVATAATAPLGERAKWKELSLDGGQTLVEKFAIKLPAIRTATTFLLKFYEEGNVVEAGSIAVMAYPEEILGELKPAEKARQIAILLRDQRQTPAVDHLAHDPGAMSVAFDRLVN